MVRGIENKERWRLQKRVKNGRERQKRVKNGRDYRTVEIIEESKERWRLQKRVKENIEESKERWRLQNGGDYRRE